MERGSSPSESKKRFRALLVGGSPEPSSLELVRELAHDSEMVVGVDRGANVCLAAGIVCDLFVGDADTISPEALAWVKKTCPDEELFDTEKYATDLALAFLSLRERYGLSASGVTQLRAAGNKVFGERDAVSNVTLAGQVAVSCASGGKPDHLLGVFGTLAENADLSPVLIEDNFECHILSPSGTKDWEIASTYAGSTFSLFALAPDTYVSEQGMEWDLERRYIPVLSDLGVSNVIGPDGARCTCHSGVAAAFLR